MKLAHLRLVQQQVEGNLNPSFVAGAAGLELGVEDGAGGAAPGRHLGQGEVDARRELPLGAPGQQAAEVVDDVAPLRHVDGGQVGSLDVDQVDGQRLALAARLSHRPQHVFVVGRQRVHVLATHLGLVGLREPTCGTSGSVKIKRLLHQNGSVQVVNDVKSSS